MINHLPTQKNLEIPVITCETKINTTSNPLNWEAQQADVVTDLDELLDMVQLNEIKSELYIPTGFGLRVPRSFIRKMRIGDYNDPLLRQVLPIRQELEQFDGYVQNPLAEHQFNPVTGLLHKYKSRVLVTLTGACAIHCRYCFRQHFNYNANLPSLGQLEKIQYYIEAHPEVDEVILSGGDPLSVSNRRFFKWLSAIESMQQVHTIRIHSRMPVVIPDRLQSKLLTRLGASRCKIVMVIHCNHAQEIDDHTLSCLSKTQQQGITLLNQAVLLRDVNDTVEAQVNLSKRLFEAGVMPYYLHLLDKVAGAAHFDVLKKDAIKLYWQLLEQLPGYLVPRLVQELPNHPFKTPINIFDNAINN